ncbi:hypothetical protein AVEN_122354-1 [Araneus ventricosus]|uniref:Uncharacterized protein n=1 Tax=Araneus ventricosus TaxID=182803 RepID=A0A4Y2NBK9_ARAVE|nr:hypothetical protein AVEN_122354-1 [Araneus ventricosus]
MIYDSSDTASSNTSSDHIPKYAKRFHPAIFVIHSRIHSNVLSSGSYATFGCCLSSARPSPRLRSLTENHEPAQDFQRGSSSPAPYMREDGVE